MKNKREFITNILYWGVIGGLLLLFFKFLFPALIPFVIAFIVAYIIRFFAKKIGGESVQARKTVALIITLVFYGVLFSIMILLGVQLIDKAVAFIQSIPDLYTDSIVPLFQLLVEKAQEIALHFDEAVALEVQKSLNEFQASIGSYIYDISFKAVGIISDGILGIPSLLIKLIVTVVSTFFLTVDFDLIMGLVKRLIGETKYNVIRDGLTQTRIVIFAYLKSYTILFCLTFVELSIGFWLFRLPYPVYLALAIAVFDILPILGTGGVLIPWALICILIGKTPLGIGIFVLYLVVTAIRNTIEPKVIGKQIGLHPLATLMAMFTGLNLFGLIGLIGCPVLLVIVVNMSKAGMIKLKFTENQE